MYLILSSIVLWVSYSNLIAKKREKRMIPVSFVNRGRGEITDGTLAKIGSFLLCAGLLFYLGPRPFTVLWSFLLALAIDGYIYWGVLKLD